MRLTLHLSAIDNMSKIVRGATNRSLASLQQMQKSSTKVASKARSSTMDAGIMAAGGILALRYPLQMAANYEKLRLSMNIFTGNVKDGGRIFQETIDLAARTPLGLQEIARATTMMMGYGQAADDALKSTKMLGDITALTPAGDLNAAIVAYGQAAQEGKALTRDLRQFINAGVPIVDILKKTFGSDAKIMDLASQGKITFRVLKESLEAATSSGGKFNEGLKQLSETASGQWVVLIDEIGRMAAVFGDSVLPMMKDLMTWIRPVVSGFAAWAKENQWFAKTVMFMVMAFTAFAIVGTAVSAVVWISATAVAGFASAVQGAIFILRAFKFAIFLTESALVLLDFLFLKGSVRTFALSIWSTVIPALGAAATATWGWITSIGALTASIFAIPIVGWILAAISAIGLLSVVIWKNWDAIVEFFSRVKDKFMEFVEFGRNFGTSVITGIVAGMKIAMPLLFGAIESVRGAVAFFGGDSSTGTSRTPKRSIVKEFANTNKTVSGAVNDIARNTVNQIGFSGVAPVSEAGGSNVTVTYNPTIHMGAGSGAEGQSDMAVLLEEHKTDIHRIVKEEVRLAERKKV